jgi:hypothetical protein
LASLQYAPSPAYADPPTRRFLVLVECQFLAASRSQHHRFAVLDLFVVGDRLVDASDGRSNEQ